MCTRNRIVQQRTTLGMNLHIRREAHVLTTPMGHTSRAVSWSRNVSTVVVQSMCSEVGCTVLGHEQIDAQGLTGCVPVYCIAVTGQHSHLRKRERRQIIPRALTPHKYSNVDLSAISYTCSPGSPFPAPLPRFLLYPGGGALPFTSAVAGGTPAMPVDVATPSSAAAAAAAAEENAAVERNSPRPVAPPSPPSE